MNRASKLTGLALASAAAGLILSGCESWPTQSESAASEAKVHCAGINACKGQTACATATNSCKGENSCKGQGWLPRTKAECEAEGGEVMG